MDAAERQTKKARVPGCVREGQKYAPIVATVHVPSPVAMSADIGSVSAQAAETSLKTGLLNETDW